MDETPLSAVRKLTKAWIRKDAAGMSRWLTDDITEIGPAFESALTGRKGFFRRYQGYFNVNVQVTEYRILQPRTMQLSPTLALVYFHYRMRTQKGKLVRDSRGKESMVAEKNRDGWRIKFLHWHEDPQF